MKLRQPRVKYYLQHTETGQRYPVANSDVVIGRGSGDILFPDDERLSHQHCRIVQTPEGLGIHDLGTKNGTRVDNQLLDPAKVYAFKPGMILQAGAQSFTLTEVSSARRIGRRRRRQPEATDTSWTQTQLLTLVFVGLLSVLVWQRWQIHQNARRDVAAIASPYEIVQKEVRSAIDAYKSLGQNVQSGITDDKTMALQIRKDLLPRFKLVRAKLDAIRPSGELERRFLESDKSLCAAVTEQLLAMAENADLKSPKSAQRLAKASQHLEKINKDAQALRKTH